MGVSSSDGRRPDGRRRRAVRRLALAGAVVSFAMAMAAPGARAERQQTPAAAPDSFGGAASTAAMGVAVLTPPLVPVEGLFDLGFVEGRGTYESSNQEGRASLFYPGSGIVTGPSLLCGTFLGPNIPPSGMALFGPMLQACGQYKYPLAVYVDSLKPDGSTEGALGLGAPTDPVSMKAVGAKAHAGPDATTTEAEASDLKVLGAPAFGSLKSLFDLAHVPVPDATLVAADGMTAHTDQRIVDGALVVDAEARVSGLRLLGGIVRIDNIDAHSHLVSAPGKDPEVSSGIEVSGVTVAGTPAQITDQGLVLGSPQGGTGPLLQQLSRQVGSALEGAGFRISTLANEQGADRGIPFARTGGLLIEFSTPLAGLPQIPGPIGDLDLNGSYGVRVTVGTTGVRGFADNFGSGNPVSGPATTRAATTGVGASGGTTGRPTTSAGRPTGTGAPASTATTAAPTSTDTGGEAASFTDGLFARRMGFLYLSFTLTAIGLCLAPRLTLPARLPAVRS